METKIKSNFGPVGLAEVRVLQTKVKVLYEDGDIYELPVDAWPPERKNGHYVVGLSKDRTKIMFAKPPGGMAHLVKFKEFKRRGGEIPEPYLEPASSKVINGKVVSFSEEWRFKATLVITGEDAGIYNGLPLTYALPYIFEPDMVGNVIMSGSKGQLQKLETFLRAAGLTNEDVLTFSTNVLLPLEKLLQSRDRTFKVTTNDKGFIVNVIEEPILGG